MSDDYTFRLIGAGTESEFGGYVSEHDRTTLSRRFLVKGSKNVYLKRSGIIGNRPGLKRRGEIDITEAPVLASNEWETSLNRTLPLRVADGKLQVESDIVESGTYLWYTLLSGLTSTRLIFDTWWDNTAKKDLLLFCDGTASMKKWSGGMGLLTGTTATTISFSANAATLGFDTGGGTVIINDTEYVYTGITTTDLTGVTPDPTGEAVGSVVIQKPDTDADTVSATYLIDFIKVINNQLHTGSETSRLVYISKNTDWDDFSQSSPRAAGEGDILTLDENPTGIGQRDGKAHIATKKAWYVVSFNQITIGSDLSEQTLVERIPMALKKGAMAHEFMGNVGNDLIYMSLDHQIHVFGTFRNIDKPQFPSLSADIETELKDEDFTGGHMKVAGDFIYLTAPNNGRVWLHETQTRVNDQGDIQQRRIWHSPFIWNISRIAVINDVEYGHSNANPQIYQLWSTLQWHDDGPTEDDPLPYDSVAAFAYSSGKRNEQLSVDKIFFEGYMTPGSDVQGAVVFEYKGESALQQIELNTDDITPEFYIGDVGIALGDATLGDNPLGYSVSDEEADQELLPKFRIICGLEPVDVFEYQVRVHSSELDSRWELLALGGNEKVVDGNPTFLTDPEEE